MDSGSVTDCSSSRDSNFFSLRGRLEWASIDGQGANAVHGPTDCYRSTGPTRELLVQRDSVKLPLTNRARAAT